MTIQCKACGQLFQSLLVVPEGAANEIANSFITHLQSHHGNKAKKLAENHLRLVNILVWYMAMGKYASWDKEKEAWLSQQFDDWTVKISKMLGPLDDSSLVSKAGKEPDAVSTQKP